jgi:hypothetical protein
MPFSAAASLDAPDAAGVWQLDSAAALALPPVGSPFADPRFLTALERFDQGWATCTVGAVADDSTHASVTLARKASAAMSIPFGYGGIVADRALEEAEVRTLLRLVAGHLKVKTVTVRSVPLPLKGRPAHACGTVTSSTAIVPVSEREPDLLSRLAKKARQSIRRAARAGVVITVTQDPVGFLEVYNDAARRYQTVYPTKLLERLAASGLARIYQALVGDEIVAGAFVLVGGVEWMYWLAAESDRGRRVEAGYPLVAQLLVDAQGQGAQFVNLGGSAGLPGVAKFKRRMAGIEVPVIENRLSTRRLRVPTLTGVPAMLRLAGDWRSRRLVRRR